MIANDFSIGTSNVYNVLFSVLLYVACESVVNILRERRYAMRACNCSTDN